MGTQEMQRVIRIHTLEAIFQVMEAAIKLSQRAKQLKKIAVHLEYLGDTTFLPLSVSRKAGDCLFKQSNGRHEA